MTNTRQAEIRDVNVIDHNEPVITVSYFWRDHNGPKKGQDQFSGHEAWRFLKNFNVYSLDNAESLAADKSGAWKTEAGTGTEVLIKRTGTGIDNWTIRL